MDSFAPIKPSLIDVFPSEHDGYPDHLAAQDTPDALRDACGDASREFPRSLWIEPSDWADAARDNDKYNTWGMNYLDRYTNQTPTHECTCHSLRANAEAARNRQLGLIYPEGPKKDFRYDESAQFGSVWLSPLFTYARANPRQWGGANVRQVLELAVRHGMLPETIQPHDYGFKHALHGTTGKGGKNQASGPWVPVSRFPEGCEETAANFKPLEIVFPESWEQAVCLLLHGHVVSVGRNGHAVPWAIYMVSNGGVGYPDSYDVTRYDSATTLRSAWRGSFSIITMTIWEPSEPAGGVA